MFKLETLLLVLLTASFALPAGAQMHSDRERLEGYIARTGEILERAREFVSDAPNPRSIRILEEAERSHRMSMEHMQMDQPRMAYARSERARHGARQAARIARELAGNHERMQRRMERFLEVRDRVAERVRESGDERALRFLQEAEEQAARARDLQKQGDVALGLKMLEGAEALLARAARLSFEGQGRFEHELERTRQFLDRVREQVGDDPAGRELLTSAEQALERAENAAASGEVMPALHSLQLARRLARQAAASGEHLEASSVERQIERFDERFERVSERVKQSGSEPAEHTLQRARVHRDRAGELLGEGELEAAMRQLKAGFDLMAAAHELAG